MLLRRAALALLSQRKGAALKTKAERQRQRQRQRKGTGKEKKKKEDKANYRKGETDKIIHTYIHTYIQRCRKSGAAADTYNVESKPGGGNTGGLASAVCR